MGFCWGGTVAHVAANKLEIDAAVSYYGGRVAHMLDERPRCPMLYHFGADDHAIPLADVERIRRALPEAVVHVYENAGHGFACDERASYDAAAAKRAFERSIEFLRKALPAR